MRIRTGRYRFYKKATFYVAFFALFATVHIFGQSDRITLARNLEADGQFEKALAIYESLYGADSNNLVISDRLKGVYKILGRNESRIAILLRQIRSDSTNIAWWGELADSYYRIKSLPDADAAIQSIVRVNPKSPVNYRIAAAVLIENRRLDDVEKLYRNARTRLEDPNVFILELAKLYEYRSDFYAAAREYFQYFAVGQGTFDYVRGQILQFPDNRRDLDTAIKALKEFIPGFKKDIRLSKLLSECYFKARRYDDAFAQAQTIDETFGKQGTEILNFGAMAFDNKVYDAAEKAYRLFLERYPNAPQAEIGIARCLERRGDLEVSDQIRDTSASVRETAYSDRALQAYLNLIRKYPQTEWAAESYFHIGEIALLRLFDIDQAIENFSKVEKDYPGSSFRPEAMFHIGECYLIKGRLSDAGLKYRKVMEESTNALLDERALFGVSELLFYQQSFDSCQKMMQAISRQDGWFTNDALSYLMLLQETSKEREGLKVYAKADLLVRQKRYSESLALLEELIRSNPGGAIVDDALMKTGMIYEQQGRYREAIGTFQGITEMPKGSPLGDLAQKYLAEVYEQKLGDHDAAAKAYKELLIRFPKSIYQSEARKKLRIIESRVKSSS